MISFQHTVLANGLDIIGEHNPQAQSFAAGYFVKTGSRDEQEDIAGVSHFLEHMMFKGTKLRSAEDINREFDELGANYNAFTSDERTVYYGAVLLERREKLLDLLSDMMRPALRQADFDIEKNVILEEIAMYEDRPGFKVFEEGNKLFYGSHPLGNSVLGSPESIQNLRREQMLAYFNERYAPNNLILTVAGNYDWESVLAQVESLTASWQSHETKRNYPSLQTATGQRELLGENLKRVHVAAYAPGLSAQDPRRYAAAILAHCLGDSSGSRLYWSLVDNGLAESASLSHDSADGVGTFIGYLSTGPKELKQALEIFHNVLQGLDTVPLRQDEWERAQRKLATSLTLQGETPFGRLMSLGSSYQYNQEYLSVQDVISRIMSASLADAVELLEDKPFDRLFTVALGPKPAAS